MLIKVVNIINVFWTNLFLKQRPDAIVNRKFSLDMKQRALQLIDEGWELSLRSMERVVVSSTMLVS